MGRCEKATDKVEILSQRTSILHNGEENGLKDFANSRLLSNEMLLCGLNTNTMDGKGEFKFHQ